MLQFDAHAYPHPSRRVVQFAVNGMVATSQALAAQAGLTILQQGGNAIDAAVATAACLTVVEPTSNGIGGDAFAIIWHKDRCYGLNASGPAARRLSIDLVKQAGHQQMPKYGWLPVTVPGVPAAWEALLKRFGRLDLKTCLAPAIAYAEQGFPVTPTVATLWRDAVAKYAAEVDPTSPLFKPWFDTFTRDGEAPQAGRCWRLPHHAETLQVLAEDGAAAFYRGRLAEQLLQFVAATGGYLQAEDLAAYMPEWVDPISISYRGYDVWELPPNGQGLVALLALKILSGFEFTHRDLRALHHQIEAIKLAFADGLAMISDPSSMRVSVEALLSDDYAAERRALINPDRALDPAPGTPPQGDTVYLATADAEGNMVSFIQSNYMGFGAGIVVPGTGICLHNRGFSFSLDPEHPNALAGGKRPYHTIIPGFLSKDGRAVGPFGVMGGFMQPQGHVQVIMNALDFGMNPQAALDAPRFRWLQGKRVEVEASLPDHLVDGLLRKGHELSRAVLPLELGRGQLIWRTDEGFLAGATEPRADGAVVGW